jgi:hypothetical protein
LRSRDWSSSCWWCRGEQDTRQFLYRNAKQLTSSLSTLWSSKLPACASSTCNTM